MHSPPISKSKIDKDDVVTLIEYLEQFCANG